MAEATAPKRKSGPRVVKDKVLYMVFKGQLEGEPTFEFDKDKVIDLQLGDKSVNVKRIVVPRGKPRKPAA